MARNKGIISCDNIVLTFEDEIDLITEPRQHVKDNWLEGSHIHDWDTVDCQFDCYSRVNLKIGAQVTSFDFDLCQCLIAHTLPALIATVSCTIDISGKKFWFWTNDCPEHQAECRYDAETKQLKFFSGDIVITLDLADQSMLKVVTDYLNHFQQYSQ